MNKYSCLINYTVFSYDSNGEKRKNLTEDYFYKYIEKHKEDFETIKNVVLKIKILGIDRITLREHLDFTTMQGTLIEYALNTSYDCEFPFLENMEAIPTYLSNPIRYRTSLSSYCIYLQLIHFYGSVDKINEHSRRIELNSLIFNPDRLPNVITRESTIGVIKNLIEKNKAESKDIKDAVDVSIATDKLKSEFESLKKRYDTIDKVKENQELKELLIGMQNIMAKLQTFEESFSKQIIDTYPDLSEDIIKKEKTQEEDRRYNSIDWC